MALRVGILGVAHVHTGSYVHSMRAHPDVDLVAFHDPDPGRAAQFQEKFALRPVAQAELLGSVDAVVISGTNIQHLPFALAAAGAKVHMLTEKPIATNLDDADAMISAAASAGVNLMVGFPCRFSPAWASLKRQVASGAIGQIRAINATNRGTCPFDWFVDPAQSGGGAMIDHTVHVADLLKDLLNEEPTNVVAQVGSNMYGQSWEDTAILSLDFPSGVFATLDSSWSRIKTYKTWGDVTMTLVGDAGVIEMDMFGQEMEAYSLNAQYGVRGFGSNLDADMIHEFVSSCLEARRPLVTGEDGRAALRVAMLGYHSVTAA